MENEMGKSTQDIQYYKKNTHATRYNCINANREKHKFKDEKKPKEEIKQKTPIGYR